MLNNKIKKLVFTLTGLLIIPMHANAAGTVYEQGKSVEVLGSEMGATVSASTTSSQQVASAIQLTSLGTNLDALFALIGPPNTINGTTYTEVYSFGKRVFSNAAFIQTDGTQLVVGLAPTQVRVPVVSYPVGPLLVRLDGGARFQANLSLNNMTNISIPIQHSEPGFQLQANAAAAGFVEGYGSIYMLRAGVGGQLDLVDAKLNVNSRFSLDGSDPTVTVSAIAEFLKGRIYAFLDIFGIFEWGWKRLIDYDLYSWNGYCFSAGSLSCPSK